MDAIEDPGRRKSRWRRSREETAAIKSDGEALPEVEDWIAVLRDDPEPVGGMLLGERRSIESMGQDLDEQRAVVTRLQGTVSSFESASVEKELEDQRGLVAELQRTVATLQAAVTELKERVAVGATPAGPSVRRPATNGAGPDQGRALGAPVTTAPEPSLPPVRAPAATVPPPPPRPAVQPAQAPAATVPPPHPPAPEGPEKTDRPTMVDQTLAKLARQSQETARRLAAELADRRRQWAGPREP